MHGTVTLRAPELENPCLGTIRIEEEDRGLPLHLYSYLGTGDAWEVIASSKEFESRVPTARLSVAEVSSTTRLSAPGIYCEGHIRFVCKLASSKYNHIRWSPKTRVDLLGNGHLDVAKYLRSIMADGWNHCELVECARLCNIRSIMEALSFCRVLLPITVRAFNMASQEGMCTAPF